ncbi:MAG: heme lyase CcmF/NrfE family subunit [Proteobacteria bacterium]|nr:heme lyase CcmF/NrfE family subunit [Pseudomonadota bacterium]NCA28396.1 heme lyase CcmF/NrfE family subunit [Pseudomonadota bacterium]
MAPTLGFSALILNLSTTFFGTFFYFFYQKKYQPKDFEKIYFLLCLISFLSAIGAQIFLIYSFIISDYSVINVYQNSHHLKPLIYKIAGSWGNHEGSMLLLITVLSLYNLFFAFFSKLENPIKISAISIQQFVIALFCSYTAITSNPFLQSLEVPTSGRELNPILQDIGLALHPPMLYVGYLGFSMVFSITMGAIISKKFTPLALKSVQIFTYFAFATLTLGIALGSWWAYRELGWGGYWFWDPVENISLMPWVSAIALIHATKVAKNHQSMQSWSAFMAIITMILCLLGIFLTRSGVLTSVHSFAISANRGFFIIFLISIIGGLGLFIFAKNFNLSTNLSQQTNKNRNFYLILGNNYFLITALLVIMIGTLYPILARGLMNEIISIGAPYYNQVFSLLLMPFLTLFVINSLNLKKFLTFKNCGFLCLSIIITVSFFITHRNMNFINLINLFLSFYALFVNFFYTKQLASKIAHSGFLVLIVGVIISYYGSHTKEINISLNQKFTLDYFTLEFTNLEYRSDKNFIARIGVFDIYNNSKLVTTLKPELRLYPVANQTTNESAIYHHPLYDLYLVIGNKDENENYAVRAYLKAFISLIWIGVSMIIFAIIINSTKFIFKKIRQKK